jgi:hypothetical protein
MSGLTWWYRVWLTNPTMLDVKAWVAAAGAIVLFWYFLGDYVPELRVGRRVRDGLLAFVGIVSFFAFFNFGRFHFDPFIHYYEFYHYYLGAKYTPEIEYTRLYECTVIAEAETDPHLIPALRRLKVRDLTTNELMSAVDVMWQKDDCKAHFTQERWASFKRDSHFFEQASSWGYWSFALMDNGFNGTPVWALFAGPLANLGNIDDAMLLHLGYLDPILLCAMWAFALWAFGWRPTCVALIFWGTNFAARYFWNGGAFLRMDWLFCAIAAICCMKKEKPAASGVFLTLAALLRVFPGFVVVPLLMKVAYDSWRAKKLVIGARERRFAVAAILTIVVLVPLATWRNGGPHIWTAFVENSRKHLKTPLTNNMGLKAVFSWSSDTRAIKIKEPWTLDPFHRWKVAQRENFESRSVLFYLTLAAFMALLAAAAARNEHWVAMCLGCGFILMAAELTSYYFSILLALGFLWPRIKWLGFVLALASVESLTMPNLRWFSWDDDSFVLTSLVWCILVVAVTYVLARPLFRRGETA